MTRFDAADAEERRRLVVDALAAHRERGSPYVTLTTEPDGADVELEHGAPWVQYFDDTLALDCTDEELERLKALVRDYPSATIDELVTPEEAAGTHARVTVRTDDDRVAQLVDDVFTAVYGRPDDYRLWAVEV
ncbi:hypothetical protein [Haloarchaeobius salinus]|uniref:hypothetical protein n=1 Tax=Haloarchaeobius salinus TaxID=1198298 RepID=UPI00210E2C4E|nr:hypothetical protein [Haloarchaeobius salinus]